MNYAAIMLCDTLNGVGFRTSLFVSGCGKKPKCKYCQNKEEWDFNYGNKFTEKEKNMIFKEQEKPWMKGISLLGGEVTDNLDDGVLLEFLKEYKEKFPTKDIWCWTGYKLEDLTSDNHKKLLSYVDVLIDGEYDYTKKNLNRAWANSENQRIFRKNERGEFYECKEE